MQEDATLFVFSNAAHISNLCSCSYFKCNTELIIFQTQLDATLRSFLKEKVRGSFAAAAFYSLLFFGASQFPCEVVKKVLDPDP